MNMGRHDLLPDSTRFSSSNNYLASNQWYKAQMGADKDHVRHSPVKGVYGLNYRAKQRT